MYGAHSREFSKAPAPRILFFFVTMGCSVDLIGICRSVSETSNSDDMACAATDIQEYKTAGVNTDYVCYTDTYGDDALPSFYISRFFDRSVDN